jgi:hypothetical protein
MDVYYTFVKSFPHLPFGARLNSRRLCTHGGICPKLESVSPTAAVKRPMLALEFPLSDGLVGSDAHPGKQEWTPSNRRTGYLFNSAVLDILTENGRSHECCAAGFEWPFGSEGECVTVFSNTDSCEIGNDAAVAQITEGCEMKFDVTRLLSAAQLTKRKVVIHPMECGRSGINSFEVELDFGRTIYRRSLFESQLHVTVVGV